MTTLLQLEDLTTRPSRRRRGGTAVEMAILLPFLVVMLLGTLDFCRLFYAYTILSDCALNGAAYLADQSNASASPFYVAGNPYASATNAALADASNLTPTPTVTPLVAGSLAVVKVSYQFSMFTTFLGNGPITISRQIQMATAPVP